MPLFLSGYRKQSNLKFSSHASPTISKRIETCLFPVLLNYNTPWIHVSHNILHLRIFGSTREGKFPSRLLVQIPRSQAIDTSSRLCLFQTPSLTFAEFLAARVDADDEDGCPCPPSGFGDETGYRERDFKSFAQGREFLKRVCGDVEG